MGNIKENVCNKFNELLESSGMKKTYVAEKLKVNRNTITRWLSGESCPEIDNIEAMANLFGVDSSVFFLEKASPNVIPQEFLKLAARLPLKDKKSWSHLQSTLEVMIEEWEKDQEQIENPSESTYSEKR